MWYHTDQGDQPVRAERAKKRVTDLMIVIHEEIKEWMKGRLRKRRKMLTNGVFGGLIRRWDT